MRILIRANSHRSVDDGVVEVAASPDTPGRETWQWQVRVIDRTAAPAAPADQTGRRVTAEILWEDGEPATIESATASEVVSTVEVIRLRDTDQVTRDVQEVVVLVVARGQVRVEGRHLLREMDVLILEGNDPLSVELEREVPRPTDVALVRVRAAAADRPLSWVP